jgi:hypothetical protein
MLFDDNRNRVFCRFARTKYTVPELLKAMKDAMPGLNWVQETQDAGWLEYFETDDETAGFEAAVVRDNVNPNECRIWITELASR